MLGAMELRDLIGTEIFILAEWFSKNAEDFGPAILHGVEPGGIWIETKNINQNVLDRFKTTMLATTPVVFLPYHKIEAIVSEVAKTLLSDKLAR
jgi:hypothetical protein